MPDWIEYALGLDSTFRTSSVPQHQIESIGGVPYLTLRAFKGPMLPPDMTLGITTSGNLFNWSPATTLTNTATELKARDTVGTNAATARFIRIEATRQTPNP